jgi:hypothetical protein
MVKEMLSMIFALICRVRGHNWVSEIWHTAANEREAKYEDKFCLRCGHRELRINGKVV